MGQSPKGSRIAGFVKGNIMHICHQCHRHIRESKCPFCQAETASPPPLAGNPIARVGMPRAALLAGAFAITGCQVAPHDVAPPQRVAVANDLPAAVAAYGVAPAYGIAPPPPPPVDAHVSVDAATNDAATDAGHHHAVRPRPSPPSAVALYGIPPQRSRGDH